MIVYIQLVEIRTIRIPIAEPHARHTPVRKILMVFIVHEDIKIISFA